MRAIEWDVGENRVRVRRDGTFVRIYWACGDHRTFSPQGLKAALEHVEMTAARFPDVRVKLQDYNNKAITVSIKDDQMTVAEGTGEVSWRNLKKTLKKAMK